MRARVVLVIIAVASLVGFEACKKSNGNTSDAAVTDFIAGASAFGGANGSVTGTQQNGQPPAPGNMPIDSSGR